jgi:hypothetical protein
VDGLATALMSSAGSLGVGGVLLGLFVWVARNATTDRADYRAALLQQQERHAAELDRIGKVHAAELAERTARWNEDRSVQERRISDLEERVEKLTVLLEAERERRWKAEDRRKSGQ